MSTWQSYIKEYQNYLRLERGLSKNTIENYTFDVEKLLLFLNQKEIDTVITKLNVMSTPSLLDKNVVDHSAFLHLFEKEDGAYKQKYIYTTSPFDINYIIKDITKIQGELK